MHEVPSRKPTNQKVNCPRTRLQLTDRSSTQDQSTMQPSAFGTDPLPRSPTDNGTTIGHPQPRQSSSLYHLLYAGKTYEAMVAWELQSNHTPKKTLQCPQKSDQGVIGSGMSFRRTIDSCMHQALLVVIPYCIVTVFTPTREHHIVSISS